MVVLPFLERSEDEMYLEVFVGYSTGDRICGDERLRSIIPSTLLKIRFLLYPRTDVQDPSPSGVHHVFVPNVRRVELQFIQKYRLL